MLTIRLFRTGRKHQPSYKVVVTDKRKAPRGGRFTDEVGSWNPLTKQRIMDKDKIKEWISKGAKPSDTVYNMLVEEKIVEGKKIDVHKKSKKEQAASSEAKTNKPIAPKEEPKEKKEEVKKENPVEAQLVEEKKEEELTKPS